MLNYKNRKFFLTVNGKKIEAAWHGPEPDEDGIVRTRTGWRKLLPDFLAGRGRGERR